jgi:hypothetical protein
VRPGTTSDVYSVNAAGLRLPPAVGGPGSLNQAYSAIATTPGANVPQGQQGWNQLVYIRGGDYSDVANELDGIPVQRASDYAPITTLASLGSQEVQTYTGGTPPSAEASGLSGFINQVIKTGVYPGYEEVRTGVGAPTFYHQFSAKPAARRTTATSATTLHSAARTRTTVIRISSTVRATRCSSIRCTLGRV